MTLQEQPSEAGRPPAVPPQANYDFRLTTAQDPDDDMGVGVEISFTATPSPTEPASRALLHGYAILLLTQQGAVDEVVETLFGDTPPTEADVCGQIAFLMQVDANDLPV